MPVTSLPSSFLILQPPFSFSYQLSSSSSLAFNSIRRPLYSPSNTRFHSPRDNASRGGWSGALSCALPISTNTGNWVSEIHSKSFNSVLSVALTIGLFFGGIGLAEAKVGVNKPQLLPKEYSTVIDVAGFLSDGQEKRLSEEIAALEKDTGFKLRVLAQNYPETPGLAIKDFWQVDDRTIVFVADPTFGNILNFNVGASVDLDIPRSFWSRLAGKYGNIFYWKEKGEDASIEAAVMAISNCLREPVEPNNCSDVK